MQLPSRTIIEDCYRSRRGSFEAVLRETEAEIRECLESAGLHPSIKKRVKTFPSYFKKLTKILQKSSAQWMDDTQYVTDIVGFRIVCPFLKDVSEAEREITRKFEVVEVERKGADLSFKEFGYESTHVLIKKPVDQGIYSGSLVCEIQIRTILQDAWAEVEHELIYKAEFNPFDEPLRRKLAALNANLSLSDIIFQEIRDYQHQLNIELSRRRDSFYKKVENAIDADLFETRGAAEPAKDIDVGAAVASADSVPVASVSEGAEAASIPLAPSTDYRNDTIDNMLLEALLAHNSADFEKAIGIYTRIIELDPKPNVKAVIYKHRGMARFAESKYESAYDDFSKAIGLEERGYRIYYFRAVVLSVLEKYEEAIRDFDSSIALNPYQFFAFYRRAQAYYHLGDYPKALSDCEQSLKIDPNAEHAKSLRGIILGKLSM
jgi:putative GTP pyrophosphokinase